MKAKYILSAAVAISLASCSNSNEPIENDGAAIVTANIGEVVSRATNTTWENNDAIGISTTSSGKTQYANMHYYTTGGNNEFTHAGGKASGIFFQSMDEVTFSAYYPWTGTEGTLAGVISGNTANQTNQTNFDYLFAESGKASRTNPTLEFTFKHKMTRLVLTFKTDAGSGFSASDVSNCKFYIGGIKHDGTFNTATGEAAVSATGNAAESWEITAANTSTSQSERTYSMIFFPQSVSALKVVAAIGGENYGCEISPALAAGTSYNYTITIKKTGLTVGNCTISDWNTVNSGSLPAEMQ